MPDNQTPWVVKGVSADTRRKVKVYAAEHDMTMAQAVEELIGKAASGSPAAEVALDAGPTQLLLLFQELILEESRAELQNPELPNLMPLPPEALEQVTQMIMAHANEDKLTQGAIERRLSLLSDWLKTLARKLSAEQG